PPCTTKTTSSRDQRRSKGLAARVGCAGRAGGAGNGHPPANASTSHWRLTTTPAVAHGLPRRSEALGSVQSAVLASKYAPPPIQVPDTLLPPDDPPLPSKARIQPHIVLLHLMRVGTLFQDQRLKTRGRTALVLDQCQQQQSAAEPIDLKFSGMGQGWEDGCPAASQPSSPDTLDLSCPTSAATTLVIED
ncbi:hypothetical protein CVT26_012196, partial [Gymnopilus dilepis]